LEEQIKFTVAKFSFCKGQEGFWYFIFVFVLVAKMTSVQICLWEMMKRWMRWWCPCESRFTML